jgi:Ras-related protein Rab-2A
MFLTLKFVIIGDTEVGKSALLLRFTEQKYRDVQDLTVGVEFGARMVTMSDGSEVKLEIWDTAGQEAFLSITRSYYRGADGALLVFDVARRATFENIPRWLTEAHNNASNDALKLVLVGAKADRVAKRQVGSDEAAAFARKHGMAYVETSSKTAQGVDDAFLAVAQDIYRTQTMGVGGGRGGGGGGGAGGGQQGERSRGDRTVNLKPSSTARKKKSGGAGCC